MSSTSHSTMPIPGSKKRRLQGACDTCRHKKIKCDSAIMPGNRCSPCIAFNSECTHSLLMSKRRMPETNTGASDKSYIEDLEQRVKKLESLLQKANVEMGSFDSRISPPVSAEDNFVLSCVPTSTPFLNKSSSSPSSPPRHSSESSHTSPQSTSDIPEQENEMQLVDQFKRLHLLQDDARFFGKSSSFVLLQTAIGVKQECADTVPLRPCDFRRPEYWEIPKYELEVVSASQQRVEYAFPEPDLLPSLVDLYFKTTNLIIPLLHRPTFEAQISSKLHLRDQWFGSVLLTVCALGSRYSDDPRVLNEGSDTWHSCGWKWFSQIHAIRQSFLETPCLYELQFYTLAVLYYQGSSNPQGCWVMIGLGVRYAQEVGAHRRKVQDEKPTVHDELWKRAFWLLVVMDKMVSAFVGRPCALHEEDYDIDYPLEVDDEYWVSDDPDLAFKQPPGKLSKMTAFNLLLKLIEILAVALRALYSANKSKLWAGIMGAHWEQRIVSELDSELNKWLDSVPVPLRWNGHTPSTDPELFSLSANLFCTYYYIQILIHRPFISGVLKSPGLSFPSLAICVNAARACSHLLDLYVHRGLIPPAPTCQMGAFTSGIVLLINIWNAKKSRASLNVEKEMADVHKVLRVLEVYEGRWRISGRLRDMLVCLASREELPLPETNPRTNKRGPPTDDSLPPTPPFIPLTHGMIVKSGDFFIGNKSGLGQMGMASPTPPALPTRTGQISNASYRSATQLPLHHATNGFSSYQWSNVDLSGFFPQTTAPIARPESAMRKSRHSEPAGTYTVPTTQPSSEALLSQATLTLPDSMQFAPHISPDISMLEDKQSSFGTLFNDGDGVKAMDLWSAIPGGFDVDEWGGYLASLDVDVSI